MSKKVFTILLLAVFMLAQFSIASAAQVTADGTLVGPDFMPAGAGATVTLDWTATGLPAGTTYVDIYARIQGGTYAITECANVAVIVGTSSGSGTFDYIFTGAPADGQYWEFLIAFDDAASCTTLPADAAVADNFLTSSYVDGLTLEGFGTIPPQEGPIVTQVACNTFEYWAIASDTYGLAVPTDPYSGFGNWNAEITGTFATPAPIGAEDVLLEWQYTLPASASGSWEISINPEDAAGNLLDPSNLFRWHFRFPTVIDAFELEDCATFSDISGSDYETYVRYLATLGLISGFADGTFGPDTTLTRAEASALIEISNGYDETALPATAPAGCEFDDVAAADWFSGWVWQACDDGFMNGVGGGLFDPNNLLTRGQIVTILNNVEVGVPTAGFLNTGNVLNTEWGNLYREAAWSDVSVGAFYALPVQYAYGVGVAEGTSDTTFSPDSPVTRGEFAKMLYRALSIYFGGF